MNQQPISRTGERVLGIIGIVFNILAIILLFLMVMGLGGMEGTDFQQQMEQEILNDPTLSPEDAQMAAEMAATSLGVLNTFGWVMIVMFVISTILAIVALVNLKNDRKPTVAGILFILAGLLAGILSLTAILFYVAAIMCFVRKPPMREDELLRPDAGTNPDDTPYRPL